MFEPNATNTAHLSHDTARAAEVGDVSGVRRKYTCYACQIRMVQENILFVLGVGVDGIY